MKLVFSVIVGAAVLAGCGGGSDDRLTKEEFLEQGNAICASGNEKIGHAAETAFSSPDNPSQAEIVSFATETIVPTVQDELDQLRDLSPPKEDEEDVAAILNELQTALDKLRSDPALAAEGAGFDEARRLAQAYGLAACAD